VIFKIFSQKIWRKIEFSLKILLVFQNNTVLLLNVTKIAENNYHNIVFLFKNAIFPEILRKSRKIVIITLIIEVNDVAYWAHLFYLIFVIFLIIISVTRIIPRNSR
jgi:hypothetical protein